MTSERSCKPRLPARGATIIHADCCARRRRLVSVGAAYTPAALLALFLPKCPFCLAPLLALLGVSVALPRYTYALVVALSVAAGTLALVGRRARRPRRPGAQG